MWAKVTFGEYMIPVEQLGIFESLQRVESKYIGSSDPSNTTGNGFYTYWLAQNIKMPNVELFSDEQYEAMKVLGAMGGIK
jgi:hypothetical protein